MTPASTFIGRANGEPTTNLQRLKSELARNAEHIAPLLLPGGKKEGNHWVTGDITGAPGKSFKVCLSGEKAGLCKDFANGDKGGTLIDVCMAVRGCDFNTAIAECRDLAGIKDGEPIASRPNGRLLPTAAFDWSMCKSALTAAHLKTFAEWRGFSLQHCERLRDDGLLGHFKGAFALPVNDQHGNCIGVQYFPDGSRGFYTKGISAHPLIIGDIRAASRVFGFESPWDAFAYYERCGLGTHEAIITTRGVDHAAKLAGRVPESAEFIVFRQNDEMDHNGRIPDEDWFTKIANTLEREVKSVRVPAYLKDLNDWTKEGAASSDIQTAIASAEIMGESYGRPLIDLAAVLPDPAKTLLGERYLCVGGGMGFVGPSGIGKSSASAQQDILWSLGREAFGIKAARPLRILTIQAENDDGDLGEMARGVCAGLGLSREECEQVRERVIYVTDNKRTGTPFITRLPTLLRRWRPDIVRIDPFQAYAGGDVVDPVVTKAFLREGLNPILSEFNCAAILCHHTPKATRDTSGWRGSDWMYAGAGNADITNWARAMLVIDPTHDASVFRFIAAKRTARTGWRDADGRTEMVRSFCHAGDGSIYWREATEEDITAAENAAATAKKKAAGKGCGSSRSKEDVKGLVPAIGSISKNALISKATGIGIGINRARGFIEELLTDEVLFEVESRRRNTRPELHISRHEPRTHEAAT